MIMAEAELILDSKQSTPAWARSGALRGRLLRPTWLRGLVLPASIMVLLEAAVRLGWVPAHLMPAPSQLVETFHELAEGPLWLHIAASAMRVFAGFFVGTALALVLGAVVGLSSKAEAYIEPTFQALRAVPGLAWVPLLLIWLGIDEASKITLISIGAFFPVYMNLVSGIRDVDRKLVEVGTMYGFPRTKLIRRIFIPAAMPYLFTGLRQALSMSWLCVVAAELLAATQGIGYLLTDGREVSRPDLVVVAIILLAALGKLTDTVLRYWEIASLSWRDAYDGRKS
jgi:sulfonate transport system permease protein